MKPIAYVFVIISTKLGPSRCALSYEDETDESLAFEKIKARLSLSSDKLVYASIPVFDKQSWIWDRFVGFITSNDGEIVDRLRFRLYDIERISMEFFDDVNRAQSLAPTTSKVWPETYLSYFAVVVSIQKYGIEYVGTFDWYDESMDAACARIVKSLPVSLKPKLCAIFGGCTKRFCDEIMRRHEALPCVNAGYLKFLKIPAEKLLEELDSEIMRYEGEGYVDVKSQVYISYHEDIF